MPSIHLLNLFTARPFAQMTFPRFQPRLDEISTSGGLIAVGASCDGQPAGLGLAEVSPDARGRVLSLYVSAGNRRRGMGTALLSRLEAELRARGCLELELAYLTDTPSTVAVERILEKLQWGPPETRMLLCRGDRRILDVPWIKRCSLPPGFSIFPWPELRAEERIDMLRRQELQPWYPEALSPFRDEATLEPGNSLGLRHHGEVVGWIITHRISAAIVRYTSFFVRADLRSLSIASRLLAEAFRRQAESRGLDSLGCWGVSVENEQMVRFSRRVEPYLLSVQESRGSRKLVSPPDARTDPLDEPDR